MPPARSSHSSSSSTAAAAAVRCVDLDFSLGFQEMCETFFHLPLLEQPRSQYISLNGEQKLVMQERRSLDLLLVLCFFQSPVSLL